MLTSWKQGGDNSTFEVCLSRGLQPISSPKDSIASVSMISEISIFMFSTGNSLPPRPQGNWKFGGLEQNYEMRFDNTYIVNFGWEIPDIGTSK